MSKLIVTIIAILFFSGSASAYYIPAEYQGEAIQVSHQGTVGMYDFFMKYYLPYNPETYHWAFDGLRQMAQNETDHGIIAELAGIMEKYKKQRHD